MKRINNKRLISLIVKWRVEADKEEQAPDVADLAIMASNAQLASCEKEHQKELEQALGKTIKEDAGRCAGYLKAAKEESDKAVEKARIEMCKNCTAMDWAAKHPYLSKNIEPEILKSGG